MRADAEAARDAANAQLASDKSQLEAEIARLKAARKEA